MHITEITARINAANNAPKAEVEQGLAAIARAIYGDDGKGPVLTLKDTRAAAQADKANRAAFDALAASVYGK